MFDIDHFKQINDTYGHDIGDVVLQNLSSTVLNNIRSTDILARWGGEEFMLFLPETTIDDAQHKIELLRHNIKITKLASQIENPITVSFGLTQLHFSDSKNSLLKRVDIALYNAKASGRDRLAIL
jgi:diguanylate cyclase (GGDEF)-like protein